MTPPLSLSLHNLYTICTNVSVYSAHTLGTRHALKNQKHSPSKMSGFRLQLWRQRGCPASHEGRRNIRGYTFFLSLGCSFTALGYAKPRSLSVALTLSLSLSLSVSPLSFLRATVSHRCIGKRIANWRCALLRVAGSTEVQTARAWYETL